MLLLFGFLFMLFIFTVLGIITGMFLWPFIDFPSLLLILVTLLFFLFASKSGSIIGRYIKTSFKKNYIYSRSELIGLSSAVKNTIKITLGTGGIGFFAGVIAILMNLEDKNMLGPNLAVSLITMYYAILISFFVFFPTQAWAENKINTLKDDA